MHVCRVATFFTQTLLFDVYNGFHLAFQQIFLLRYFILNVHLLLIQRVLLLTLLP